MNEENKKIIYKCSSCGLEGYRLWRQYQTFLNSITLLCADCAEADQNKTLDPQKSDSIGWLVPAVPTEDMDTFWGYTSVPGDRVTWWYSFPLRPSQTKDEYIEELLNKRKEQDKTIDFYYKEYIKLRKTANSF